jgi:hypothetical protein
MFVESLLNSANDLSKQVTGSPLELEHALIMLLLLVGLLSIRGNYRRYVPWVIVGGVALSLFTTTHIIEPAWPILSALIVPPFAVAGGTTLIDNSSNFQVAGLSCLAADDYIDRASPQPGGQGVNG